MCAAQDLLHHWRLLQKQRRLVTHAAAAQAGLPHRGDTWSLHSDRLHGSAGQGVRRCSPTIITSHPRCQVRPEHATCGTPADPSTSASYLDTQPMRGSRALLWVSLVPEGAHR